MKAPSGANTNGIEKSTPAYQPSPGETCRTSMDTDEYQAVLDICSTPGIWTGAELGIGLLFGSSNSRSSIETQARNAIELHHHHGETHDHERNKKSVMYKYRIPVYSYVPSLPVYTEKLDHLTHLDLRGSGIAKLPASLGRLRHLVCLDLSWTRSLRELPESLGMLSDLALLDIQGSGIASLPQSMRQLLRLRYLNLRGSNLRYRNNRGSTLATTNLGEARLSEVLACLAGNHCRALGWVDDDLPQAGRQALEHPLARNRARTRMPPVVLANEDDSRLWPFLLSSSRKAFARYPPPVGKLVLLPPYELSEPEAMYHLLVEGRESFVGLLMHRQQQNTVVTHEVPMVEMGE